MDDATADAIREASKAESARRAHPADVAALPPLPAARYTDPTFHALEQEHVFRNSWLLACHESEIAAPRSALALSHLPVPLFALRADGGAVRVFVNGCRHRGATLLEDGAHALGRSIVCPYHAWAYALDGGLVAVPEEREFRDLDRSCLALKSLRSERWGGFVWVDLGGEAPPLREWLGGIADDLDADIGSLDASSAHLIRKQGYTIDCNWKLAIEANLETYHVNALHRNSAAGVIDARSTTHTLLARGHSRMFLRTRQEPPREFPVKAFPHVHPIAGEGVLTYSFFPNVALVVTPQLMFTTNAWPIAPDRTCYELYFVGAEPRSASSQPFFDLSLAFNVAVIEEDVTVLGGMQRALASGALEYVRFGHAERRLDHLHRAIDATIGAERIPDALRVASCA